MKQILNSVYHPRRSSWPQTLSSPFFPAIYVFKKILEKNPAREDCLYERARGNQNSYMISHDWFASEIKL
jgi:hypothetical protein